MPLMGFIKRRRSISEQVTQGSSVTFVVLTFAFFLESLALLALVRTQPALRGEIGQWLPTRRRAAKEVPAPYNPTLDPQTGTLAPDWQLCTIEGQTMRRADFMGRQVVVLFIGRCSSCVLKQIQGWLDLPDAPAKPALILVASDSTNGLKWLSNQVSEGGTLLQDADRTAARTYNAVWVPRAYFIDERGILRYCQRGEESMDLALTRVKQLLEPSDSHSRGNRSSKGRDE